MKRLILAIPVIVITLVVFLLVAPGFVDWTQYKDQAQSQIKKLAGYDVALNGDLGLMILPVPRVFIDDVVLKAPPGSSQENLMSLERLDVNVAIMPLFSGQVVVSAVRLVKPEIALEVLKNGKGNWLTPELESLLSIGKVARAPGKKSSLADMISLENVSIKEGAFQFKNAATGQVAALGNINLDIEAETLSGPFDVSGNLVFSEHEIGMKVLTGRMDPGAKSLSVNAAIDIKQSGLHIEYGGIVPLAEPFEIQGETALQVSSLAKFLNGAGGVKLEPDIAALKGILTASPDKLSYQNLSVDAAGHKFTGVLSASLSPLSIKAQLAASDVVDFDKFLPAGGQGQRFDFAAPGEILPQSLSLPVPFDAEVGLSFPGVVYKQKMYSDVSLDLSKKDKSFHTRFLADGIPGKGSIILDTNLKYSSKSISKETKGETFSNPALFVSLKGDTQNISQTLQALSGDENLALSGIKTGRADVTAALTPAKLQVSESTVVLDNTSYKVSGTLENKVAQFTVAAYGGQLDVKGVLDGITMRDMAVRVQHRNLAEAIQTFSPKSSRSALLEKPVDFSTQINQEGKTYDLQNIKASLGSSSMTGSVSYDGGGAKPSLKGDLQFGDLVLQSAPGKTTKNKSSKGKGKNSERWSGKAIDTAWMSAVDADLNVAAQSIKYEDWDLSKPIIKLSLKDEILDIKQLESGLYDGNVSISGTVDGSASPISIKSKTKLENVSIEKLVKSFVGNRVVKGSGQVSLDTDLSTSGANQAALISALQGAGTIKGKDIVLEGFDLTRFARALSEESKPGDTLLGLWKGTTKGGSTAFDTMDGAFEMTSGVANITKMDLDGPKAFLDTKGNINLPKWTIKTAHTITLKEREDVPPFTINIDGPLDNPAQTFAEGALKDYFSRKINRKLEKLLTDKLGLPSGQSAPEQQIAPGSEGVQQEEVVPQESGAKKKKKEEEVSPEEAFRGLLEGLIE